MKIHLLRHTETAAPKGMCYGQTNVELKDDYLHDFEILSKTLQNLQYDAIYCSPLKRCVKLALYLSGDDNEVIKYDERLKELNFGDWELKYWEDIEKLQEANAWFQDYVNIPCPKGEAYIDLLDRVQHFIEELKTQSHNSVLIVCHGGVIRAFYTLLKHLPLSDSFKLNVDYGELITMDAL